MYVVHIALHTRIFFLFLKGVPPATTASATPSVCGASAQSLLLCCWHTMKETSLLMGLVVEWAPIGPNSDSLLTRKQVQSSKHTCTIVVLNSKAPPWGCALGSLTIASTRLF